MSGTAASSGATAPFPGQPGQPEKKPKKWLRWAVPLLAFLIGVGVGGADTAPSVGSDSEPKVEASPAFVSLKSELTESQEQTAQLEDEVAEAEKRIRQAGAESEARLAAQAAELDERSLLLDQRESDLAVRETAALRAAPPSQAAPRPAAPAPYTAPAPAPAPRYTAPAPVAPPAASAQYFDNCTAARAAGAAPVRVGDSGYGRHLDRDGDGVGCE